MTRSVEGRTVTKIIAAEAVEATNRQIAQCHHFQRILHEIVETNVKICDALLEADGEVDDDPEPAEKRGTTARSRRKSRPG